MSELLPALVAAAGFAAVMGCLVWLGSRARRRGVGGAIMGPFDEIYHPAAHRFRFEIEVHEQRMMPMPSADDQRKRSRGEVEQSGTNRRATEPQRRRGGIDDSDE